MNTVQNHERELAVIVGLPANESPDDLHARIEGLVQQIEEPLERVVREVYLHPVDLSLRARRYRAKATLDMSQADFSAACAAAIAELRAAALVNLMLSDDG